jgi:hypothetical protein
MAQTSTRGRPVIVGPRSAPAREREGSRANDKAVVSEQEALSRQPVIDLMETLRRSLSSETLSPTEKEEAGHEAEQSMLRDTDAILARIESALATERAAMDALLKRLVRPAA